jgi:hypothetical protein
MRKKKQDEVVTSKALCMKCALCDAKIGALIVVDNKLIDGQEVTQFLRTNQIIPICDRCHKNVYHGDKAQQFETS